MQLIKPGPIPGRELFQFNPQTQDKGFAQMLSEVTATQAATGQPAQMQVAEQQLTAQWPISDYAQVFEHSESVMARTAEAFERFNERARQVTAELQRYDIAHLVHIRLGVGGVTTQSRSSSGFDGLLLGQLWRTDQDIMGWSGQNNRLQDAISGLGVSHSLAKAAYHLQQSEGLTRQQALSRGVLGDYINRLLDNAFNLNGSNPLSSGLLGAQGFSASAYLSARSSGIIDPQQYDFSNMTGPQLRGNMLGLFRGGQLSLQAYSAIWHLSGQIGSSSALDWPQQVNETLGSHEVFGPVADALAEVQRFMERQQAKK